MNISHPDALFFFSAIAGSVVGIAHMSDLMRKVSIPLFVSNGVTHQCFQAVGAHLTMHCSDEQNQLNL